MPLTDDEQKIVNAVSEAEDNLNTALRLAALAMIDCEVEVQDGVAVNSYPRKVVRLRLSRTRQLL